MSPQAVQVNLVLLPTGSDADRQRAGPLTILLPQTHIALEYQTDLNVCPMKTVLFLDDFLLFREIVLAFLHHSLEAVQQQSGLHSGPAHFVSLAAATPALVISTIADGLQIALDPQGDPETQLLNYLSASRMLLVLDNFEHVVERADLVAAILTAAPEVKILTTSRERLNLQGEWLLEVGGLDVPDDSAEVHPEEFSAVQLFQEAARRARRGFSLSEDNLQEVAEICRLVDGLPLGIELAANWMRILSCTEICSEIRDNLDFLSSVMRNLPERHRSLRAVFSSSAQLLGDQGREAFQRLSVFRGGFDRQAAERVASASLPLLLDLVNKSLIAKAASSRFVMHEMLRQFASELLAESDQKNSAIRKRHSRYYLEFLTQTEKACGATGSNRPWKPYTPKWETSERPGTGRWSGAIGSGWIRAWRASIAFVF